MGIYDRDYYRKEGPSYIGAWADSGKVCKWLVIINAGMLILQLITMPRLTPDDFANGEFEPKMGFVTDWLAMRPDAVFFQGQVWRLLTGCFLHSTFSYFHIVFNMLGLWFFGRYMEDVYGHKEFLAFYLMAGVVGNLAWGLTALWTHLPGLPWPTAVGASGAVMGVMVWCALTYPHKTLLIWFVPVPFWAFALIYIGSNLFTFLGGHDMWMDTRVAVAAHLGGAAFGLLYQKLDWRLTGGNWGGFFSRMRRPAKPRLRIYREEQTASVNSRPPESRIDEQLEAKADAVLDKLKRQGKESLTDEERDILQRASEQYRKKRSGQ